LKIIILAYSTSPNFRSSFKTEFNDDLLAYFPLDDYDSENGGGLFSAGNPILSSQLSGENIEIVNNFIK